MKRKSLKINAKDNVAVMLEKSFAGDTTEVDGQIIELIGDVDFAHKIMLTDLKQGEAVYKYGEVIGDATTDIKRGEWVHDHNIAFAQWK